VVAIDETQQILLHVGIVQEPRVVFSRLPLFGGLQAGRRAVRWREPNIERQNKTKRTKLTKKN
jgi:hypothetical protein